MAQLEQENYTHHLRRQGLVLLLEGVFLSIIAVVSGEIIVLSVTFLCFLSGFVRGIEAGCRLVGIANFFLLIPVGVTLFIYRQEVEMILSGWF